MHAPYTISLLSFNASDRWECPILCGSKKRRERRWSWSARVGTNQNCRPRNVIGSSLTRVRGRRAVKRRRAWERGETRGVARARTMKRSSSVFSSPVTRLGPHMHHIFPARSSDDSGNGGSNYAPGDPRFARHERPAGARARSSRVNGRPRCVRRSVRRTRSCDTARVRVSTDMPKPGSLRKQHVCVLSDDVSQCSRVSDSSTDT